VGGSRYGCPGRCCGWEQARVPWEVLWVGAGSSPLAAVPPACMQWDRGFGSSMAASLVASVDMSASTHGPSRPGEDQPLQPGRAPSGARPGGAWERLGGSVLPFPLLKAEGHRLQPGPSLLTTGFPRGWHLLQARRFSPVVLSFWKQLVGVGRKEECCGDYPQRAWVQGGVGSGSLRSRGWLWGLMCRPACLCLE